jgi:hypothetical protein
MSGVCRVVPSVVAGGINPQMHGEFTGLGPFGSSPADRGRSDTLDDCPLGPRACPVILFTGVSCSDHTAASGKSARET